MTAAAREIILCAGAIGPPNHLRSFGGEVAVELPGGGANLQDHPIVPLVYRATRPVPAGRYNHGEMLGLIWRHAAGGPPEIQIFGVDFRGRSGPRRSR